MGIYHQDPLALADDDVEAALIQAERKASKDLECGICYEVTASIGRRFGILNACDHSFCLTCIRNWRATSDSATSSIRACPICRVESHFIIPCERLVRNPERKLKLIEIYQSKMGVIPCKHFKFGDGVCPFGSSCFYAHLDKNGTVVSRTKQLSRTYISSEGKHEIVKAGPSLADFVVSNRR